MKIIEEERDRHFNAYAPRRGSSLPVAGSIVVALIILVGVCYSMGLVKIPAEFARTSPTSAQQQDFGPIYASLNVRPLASLSANTVDGLNALGRNHCDHKAIFKIAEDVVDSDRRWVADAYLGFGKVCPTAEGELREAAFNYNEVGDFRSAQAASDLALQQSSGRIDSNLSYVRAKTYIGLGDLSNAITEFERTIALRGKKNVRQQVFFDGAETLAKAGRHCEAAEMMRDEIDYNPDDDPAQARTLLADYQSQCHGGSSRPIQAMAPKKPAAKRAGRSAPSSGPSDADLDALVRAQ